MFSREELEMFVRADALDPERAAPITALSTFALTLLDRAEAAEGESARREWMMENASANYRRACDALDVARKNDDRHVEERNYERAQRDLDVGALAFYARDDICDRPPSGDSPIEIDGGDKARARLAQHAADRGGE